MSDPRPTDEDELISRVLDGDASPGDRARVAGDARLQARLRDFERVRAAIADVEAPPAAAQDAAITAALAQAAPAVDDDGVSTDMLEYARGRRRRNLATVVAVAAALLIGIPLLAIALTGRGTEQDSASTAGLESAADAPTDTGVPIVDGAAAMSGYAGDLGSLDDGVQLQAAVALAIGAASAYNADEGSASQLAQPPQQAEASASARSSSSIPDPTPACINQLATSDPTLGGAVLTATGTWQGEPALVVVYRGATDTIVVVTDGCTVVARLPA